MRDLERAPSWYDTLYAHEWSTSNPLGRADLSDEVGGIPMREGQSIIGRLAPRELMACTRLLKILDDALELRMKAAGPCKLRMVRMHPLP